ncbi:acyl-CoA dehydrogenase family protein [Streptomyces sp. NPDC058295]|uniref:acyl-CoA dehydrogenase family protein n=1 Tax=Streptomyces sp. NPDC058295 TaxID=3346431 RepID=UPI0036E90655
MKFPRTETQAIGGDRCLQLFGGKGYMHEYPIARLYADARITRSHAGTSEVMQAVIAEPPGSVRRGRGAGARRQEGR